MIWTQLKWKVVNIKNSRGTLICRYFSFSCKHMELKIQCLFRYSVTCTVWCSTRLYNRSSFSSKRFLLKKYVYTHSIVWDASNFGYIGDTTYFVLHSWTLDVNTNSRDKRNLAARVEIQKLWDIELILQAIEDNTQVQSSFDKF